MSTLYFPQLTVGSLAQYPIVRRWSKPATINTLPDGSTIVMAGMRPAQVSWELRFAGLSSGEWDALQQLFSDSHGRFGNFTFVDPTDNLLTWSEDFTASAWAADPLLQITAGVADPFGGTTGVALWNTGQAAQRLMQSVPGPSWFQYCFSLYLRAATPCTLSLVRSSTSEEMKTTVGVGEGWSRVVSSGALSGQEDEIHFGLEVGSGTSLYIFGAQVEGQPCAGAYKRQTNRSGIYSHSRFDQDMLVQSADAAERYSTTIQIVSNY